MRMMTHTSLRSAGLSAIAALAVVGLSAPASAVAEDETGAGVARISSVSGTVSMQRGDANDVFAAAVNAPLAIGDYVTTSSGDARAEMQFDANDFVRVAPATQLRLTQLGTSDNALQLAAGTVEVSALAPTDARPQVQTPSIAVRPDATGRYRVTVSSDGDTIVSVRSGRADLVSPQGTQTVGMGTSVLVSGPSNNPSVMPTTYVSADGFDQWNAQRDAFERQTAVEPYADSGMVGLADLQQYGHWVYEPSYGQVWVAYSQPAGWAPYHTGRWVWQPYYGWTWVAYEPWGWAPYHYGSWFHTPAYGWAWYPGPVYVHPVWRPALVTFFGFGSGGGGFHFNLAFGNVGWVPLAPYEVYHPWWGPGFANRTVVYNTTNIYNTTNVTNVNITKVYRNASVPGGVAAVSSTNFSSGTSYHYVSVRAEDLRSVALVKSALPIVPTKQNLGYSKLTPNQVAKMPSKSRRFNALPAPKQPSPFDQQRAAVQTATQTLYPGMTQPASAHASTTPAGATSPWSRFNASSPVKPTPATQQPSRNPYGQHPASKPYAQHHLAHSPTTKAHHGTKPGSHQSGSGPQNQRGSALHG